MPRLRYLPSAKSDLVDIFTYITRESGSLNVGRRFVGQIRQKCDDLSRISGQVGQARPELRVDIRCFPFKGYNLFFRYLDQGEKFEVVNILEGHRDPVRVFKQGQ